jgi:hypothetical protein
MARRSDSGTPEKESPATAVLARRPGCVGERAPTAAEGGGDGRASGGGGWVA